VVHGDNLVFGGVHDERRNPDLPEPRAPIHVDETSKRQLPGVRARAGLQEAHAQLHVLGAASHHDSLSHLVQKLAVVPVHLVE